MSHYEYSPLRGELNIRLITFDPSSAIDGDLLSIQLTEMQLRDTGGFEALSYTWGDMSSKVPIKVGNRILMITANLNSFLKRLQADESGKDHAATYWADQICINQEDISERNSQVALMASIYRESCRTLVWLGEASHGETAALELLREIDALGFTRNHPVHLALPQVVKVIETRTAWVIQEVALAADCTVRVSENVYRWESLDLAVIGLATVTKKARKTLSGAPVLKTMAAAAIRHIQFCRKNWTSKSAQTRQGDFLYLLGRLGPTMDCTDPRDRVYAYLSLQPEPRILDADYALDVNSVFMKTSAALAAASQRLDIFAYTRYPPIGLSSGTSQVPSWAIDWRMPSTMSGLKRSADSSFRASGSYAYNPSPLDQPGRTLRVRGSVIDSVGFTSTRHEFPRTGDVFALMKYLDRPWIFEMASAISGGERNIPASAVSEAVLYHRIVKVLLCYDRELDDADGKWDEQLEAALDVLKRHEASPGQHGYAGELPGTKSLAPGDALLLGRFTSKTDRTSVRAIYTTQQKRLFGLAPPLTRAGDLVCVVHGSTTPIILRKSTVAGRFHVLGQSYLEGWMHKSLIRVRKPP